jgi:tape measure domain-containing protein
MANTNIEIVITAATTEFEKRIREVFSSVNDLDGLAQKLARSAADAFKGMDGAANQGATGGLSAAKRGVQSISAQLDTMGKYVFAAMGVGGLKGLVSGFVETTDAMNAMNRQLFLVSSGTEAYAAAQKTVADVARQAHQPLWQVADLYSMLARNTAGLNVSQDQLAKMTSTVALATTLSGTSAEKAAGAYQKLAIALGAGKLDNKALTAMLKDMPELAQVFIDAAGGSIAQLRKLVDEGETTTKWMADAIDKADGKIKDMAAAMPLSVGKAMTDLRNSVSQYVGSFDQAHGTTKILASAVELLGKNLDVVIPAIGTIAVTAFTTWIGKGVVAATRATLDFVAGLRTTIPAAATSAVSVTATTAAIEGTATAAATAATTTTTRLIPALMSLAGPIGIVAAALGLAAAAWFTWGSSAENALDKAAEKLKALEQSNQHLKEMIDPDLKIKVAADDIKNAEDEVAKLKKKLQDMEESKYWDEGDSAAYGSTLKELGAAEKLLEVNKKIFDQTRKGSDLSAQLNKDKAAQSEKELADIQGEYARKTELVNAGVLANQLADIETRRQAEIKAQTEQVADEEKKAALIKGINALYNAEADKARGEDAERRQKEADTAARQAQADAERRAREERERQRAATGFQLEDLRAQSEQRLLELERQKLDADKIGDQTQRATALRDINQQISDLLVQQKEQELAIITDGQSGMSTLDRMRARSALYREETARMAQEHASLKDVASKALTAIEEKWRLGTASVQEYIKALNEAGAAGAISDKEKKKKQIIAGDDIWAGFTEGAKQAKAQFQNSVELMIEIGQELPNQLANNFASAFDSFIQGSKTAGQAMADFARSTLSWLEQLIIKWLIVKAVQSMGYGDGGPVVGGSEQSFASGGRVRGWSPTATADNIPAMLTAGEFVQPVRAVDHYGVQFMDAVRRLQFPRHIAFALAGGTVPRVPAGHRLAQGGMAAAAPPAAVKAGDTKLKVVNVLGGNLVGDFMKSADGETVLLNMRRRNGSAIRTIIG